MSKLTNQAREELRKKITAIISEGVTYSAQVNGLVIHGAVEQLIKSHNHHAHTKIKDFAARISVHLVNGGEVLVKITAEVERIVKESEKENGGEEEHSDGNN